MVSKWQGLVIASLLTQPVMADSGQGSQAAAVIIPLIFIACPVVAALVLKRELPKPLHPVTTFACNIVALVSFSCAGHSIGLSHYDEKPFATSGNKYITAIGNASYATCTIVSKVVGQVHEDRTIDGSRERKYANCALSCCLDRGFCSLEW
eukprot:664544-Amorphochlora_amoeboformis.AAC.1